MAEANEANLFQKSGETYDKMASLTKANKDLISGIWTEDVEKVEVALSHGANPNIKMLGGDMPVEIATLKKNDKMASLLLKHGASVLDKEGVSILSDAIRFGLNETLKEALANGFEVDGENSSKTVCFPLLHVAASAGNVEALRALLEAGAKPDEIESETGRTALLWAIGGKSSEETIASMAKILCESGADASKTDRSSFSPLEEAIRKGYNETIKVLVAFGADPSFECSQGKKGWFYAITFGNGETARILTNGNRHRASEGLRIAAQIGAREDVVLELLAAGGTLSIVERKKIHETVSTVYERFTNKKKLDESMSVGKSGAKIKI